MLFSQTDPILESSSNIKYYCANYVYPELLHQMDKCKMSIWNNAWSDQFDFTPGQKSNFELVDSDSSNFIDTFKTVTHNIMLIQAQSLDPTIDTSQIDLSFGELDLAPIIPITTGNIVKEAQCH